MINMDTIILIAFISSVVYFGVRRYQEHKKETFEDRDN